MGKAQKIASWVTGNPSFFGYKLKKFMWAKIISKMGCGNNYSNALYEYTCA